MKLDPGEPLPVVPGHNAGGPSGPAGVIFWRRSHLATVIDHLSQCAQDVERGELAMSALGICSPYSEKYEPAEFAKKQLFGATLL